MAKHMYENIKQPKNSLGGKLLLWWMNISHGLATKWALEDENFKEESKIIDLGCGGGKTIKDLMEKDNSFNIDGIDISKTSVNKARKVNKKYIKGEKVNIYNCEIGNMMFKDYTYDIATMVEILPFLEEREKELAETKRVLVSGGKLIIINMEYNKEENRNWASLIGKNIYNSNELEELLLDAGFVNVRINKNSNGRWIKAIAFKE